MKQQGFITHNLCPACGETRLSSFLRSKDYFFSNESFSLDKCDQCGLILTNPFPEEKIIGRYYQSDDYFSHPGKKKSMLKEVYKTVRFFNIRRKFNMIKPWRGSGKVLDIGCGSGEFLAYCKEKGMDVTGLEPNNEAREYASGLLGKAVLRPEQLDSLPDKSFDIVSMWHVLEHVEDGRKQLRELHRLLKADGVAVIALPNTASDDCAYYREYWAGWDLPRHLYHFNRSAISQLASKQGFHLVKEHGLFWDAFYIAMLSSRYQKMKFAFFAGIWQGMKSNVKALGSKEYSSLVYVFKKT